MDDINAKKLNNKLSIISHLRDLTTVPYGLFQPNHSTLCLFFDYSCIMFFSGHCVERPWKEVEKHPSLQHYSILATLGILFFTGSKLPFLWFIQFHKLNWKTLVWVRPKLTGDNVMCVFKKIFLVNPNFIGVLPFPTFYINMLDAVPKVFLLESLQTPTPF